MVRTNTVRPRRVAAGVRLNPYNGHAYWPAVKRNQIVTYYGHFGSFVHRKLVYRKK